VHKHATVKEMGFGCLLVGSVYCLDLAEKERKRGRWDGLLLISENRERENREGRRQLGREKMKERKKNRIRICLKGD